MSNYYRLAVHPEIRHRQTLSGQCTRRAILFLALLTVALPVMAESTSPSPELPEGWTHHHDLEIGYIGGVRLSMEVVAPTSRPGQPLPVIAYIHGGAWRRGSKHAHSARLMGIARRGYVAASFMYRFAPEHPHPAQIEDIQAAIRFLKANAETFHLDPDRINLWGTSAGGHLASLAGTAANNSPFATNGLWESFDATVFAVVDFCGPNSHFLDPGTDRNASLAAFLGDKPSMVPDIARAAMPVTHIDPDDPPFFVAHGDSDRTVPVHWGRDFALALGNAGVPVVYHQFPGADHNINATHPHANNLAYAFLDRLNFPGQAGK